MSFFAKALLWSLAALLALQNVGVDVTALIAGLGVGGVAVADNGTIYAAVNGFSRRFTEGEGVGIGHVFQYDAATASWTDVSANFPAVPANSIQELIALHQQAFTSPVA